ncbi:sel1 repeat family protein [Sphingomonas sp.]|uniref:sel1 repeat family protein n=1 Tax=Sphingomonas sp. TaxID=28214 RepID=UPI002DB87276|nr:sel1 repeat family protein [Sphingomonas sp.]
MAKRPACPDPRARQIALLVADTNGDVTLIVARIRDRLSTEDAACWAARGDKPMLLELAKRLETGDGIAQDVERAEDLYQAAARPTVGTIYVYSPGVGKSPGMVLPVRTGPDVPGLPEAAYRRALMHIEGRAAKPSPRKGFSILRKLAKSGYAPAVARLAALPHT